MRYNSCHRIPGRAHTDVQVVTVCGQYEDDMLSFSNELYDEDLWEATPVCAVYVEPLLRFPL